MSSGGVSWAVATWHVPVDGVNVLACGAMGFSLVSSSFGLLNFKTSPSSVFFFHPFEIYFLYFF